MNLNKAIIIGNLTQNPEVKTTTNGNTVSSFSIATNRVWTDGQGQKQTQAEFHNIVAWGKLAEIVGQYLTKGGLCMVEGHIQTRSWDDQAGAKHWKTEIIAENIQLGPRPQGASSGSTERTTSYSNNNSAPTKPEQPEEEEIKIEDIPF